MFALRPALALTFLLVVVLVGFGGAARDSHGASDGPFILGDTNCDQNVDTSDSLDMLHGFAGLSSNTDCLADAGDIDCSGAVTVTDLLGSLRFVISLPKTDATPGCEAVGETLPGGGSEEARQLALGVLGREDDESRYQALLDLLAQLRVGVYTAEGEVVQQGAERGPGDFYLYDFEVRMMAGSLGRHDTSWGVQQIADTLDQLGYRDDGQPFTGEELSQILREATTDSLATPEEPSSLVPMLVRELGLRHNTPYDLAEQLDITEPQFDALQVTLIMMSLSLPVIADEGPLETVATSLPRAFDGILTERPVVGLADCGDFNPQGEDSWEVTKFFIKTSTAIGGVAKRVAALIDIIHGEQLALSVQVKALDSSVGPVHYDHGPSSPGQLLKFRIEVRMLDDLGQTLVKCGWLASVTYPPKGPIPGVRVSFQTDIQAQLKKHGTLDCSGFACDETTGADGVATLTFDPKSEVQPYGQGIQKEDTGVVSGVAWYLSKFGNLYGAAAQLLVPKYGSTRWFVQYHGCEGGGAAAEAPAQPQAAAGVPCAFEGYALATHSLPNNVLKYTITASNLRFERIEDPHPGVTYQLVSGSVDVQVTGDLPGCTISGGYSISAPIEDTPGAVHFFGGFIALDPDNNLYAASGGQGDLEEHVTYDCPPQPPYTVPGGSHLWALTTNAIPPIPDRSVTPGDPLQGSYDITALGWTSHYDWNFDPIICNPSPVPVCQ